MNDREEIIIFDADGVLVDFSKAFAAYYNERVRSGVYQGRFVDENPNTWSMGLTDQDDRTQLDAAIEAFYHDHDHLPLMHESIPGVMAELQKHFRIEVVTAYPLREKRIANFIEHNIPFDTLHCDVHNKLEYALKRLKEGYRIVAIMEDGPHHISRYLSHEDTSSQIWIPSRWNYLSHLRDHPKLRPYYQETEWLDLIPF